jgi:WD40 repeat protein
MNKIISVLSITLTLLASICNAQNKPELVLPAGHTSGILTANFSPDGKFIVTGAADNTAKIWERESGKLLHTLIGHEGWVNNAEYSRDGKTILTVSTDSTAKLWNAETGLQIRTITEKDTKVLFAGFNPDGKSIFTVATTNDIQIWDVESGKLLATLKGHSERIESATYNSDGSKIITTSWDNTVRIWDSKTGKQQKILKSTISRPVYATFSPDDRKVLTASMDEAAGIWDSESGKLIFTLNGTSEYVVYAEFSPDGKKIITNSRDETAYIYNSETGKLLYSFDDHEGRLYSVAFSPDGKNILTAGSKDKTAKIHNLQTGELILTLTGHEMNIINATYSADGKYIITTSNDNSAKLWDAKTGNLLNTLEGKTDMSVVASFCNNGKSIITQSSDWSTKVRDSKTGNIINGPLPEYNFIRRISNCPEDKPLALIIDDNSTFIYDLQNGNKILTLEDYVPFANSAEFSPDGNNLIVKDSDENIKIYNLKTGKSFFSVEGGQYQIGNYAFSPDGSMLVTCYQGDTAKLWDLKTQKLLFNLEPSTVCNNKPSFCPDGRYVAIANWDYTVKIWDTQSGTSTQSFNSNSDFVNCVIFNPNGKSVLTNLGEIWDIETGKRICKLEGSNVDLYKLSYSPNGKKIMAIEGSTIKMWESETGKLLHNFCDHSGYISNAEFSSDGKTILTAASDGKFILKDSETGKILYTTLQLIDDDWLVYDEFYRYDGTQKARDYLYFVCGNEITELAQIKDALYVPGLVEKIMSGQDINYSKLENLEICGTLPLIERIESNSQDYWYKITPRKSSFEYLEVYVNEKKVFTIPKSELTDENGTYILKIKYEDISKHFIGGIENTVKVVAVIKQSGSEIRSRGVSFKYENKNTVKANPRLFIVMVGINDYKDLSLNLKFPADDATDLGNAIRFSAEKLLGDTNVVMYIINSNVKPDTGYTTPEKEGIRKAIEDIGTKAGPEDVILLFFAGHGVMQGEQDKVFTFLTAEASSENQIGISTTELQNWLSFEGPNKILANKTILIFDACNSGQATKELMALARSDDESEKTRQVEDLRDKSGFFILTASAPNQYAYEFPQYNHGLLTYCLLYVLKNNPDILDDGKFLNVQKWFLETESYLDLLVKEMGYQQDAQPFGTSNIRIGIVDDDLKQSIILADEKPVVVCANVMNDATFDDDLHLKVLINSKLLEMSERGTDKSIMYPRQETENANKINIRYSVNGDKIKCEIRLIKQGEVLLNTSITGDKNNPNDLVSRIIAEVVKYAM